MHLRILSLTKIISRRHATDMHDVVDRFCSHFPVPLTIKQICDFAVEPDIDLSYKYVKNEIGVRLAHGIKEIELSIKKLPQTATMTRVLDMYYMNLRSIAEYENRVADSRTLSDFDDVLKNALTDLREVVGIIAKDWSKFKRKTKITEREEALSQFFLDRILANQMSIRTISKQHRRSYKNVKQKTSNITEPFSIYQQLNAESAIKDTYDQVSSQFEKYFNFIPTLEIQMVNMDDNDGHEMIMTYFPIILNHILKELFKNSIFAACYYHQYKNNKETISPIICNLTKSEEDITITITDRGGGAPINQVKNFLKYGYTTMDQFRGKFDSEFFKRIGGNGFGLPLSRTFARYFCGDIDLASVEGEGTTAFIYLKTSGEFASEVIPVYNQATVRNYNSVAMPPDWI